ncbi:hypothetical protein M1146_04470 [Patescibacteria group bacterium]|nr:hypothetical protein [Patescibacteria group bacterium]
MDYSMLVGIIYETGNPDEDNVDTEEDFIARIAAQPLPPNHGITSRTSEF